MEKTPIHYPNFASEFVALTSYAKWIPELNRRENWEEMCDRSISFLKKNTKNSKDIPDKIWLSLEDGMKTFGAMPAMRLVATAGIAAEKNNAAVFNCSYAPIYDFKTFSEMMFLLMSGVGAGYSVEKKYINKLQTIKQQNGIIRDDYIVQDSREGWSDALLFGIETWANGEDVNFDYSLLRPRGAPLKTFGGRSAGPDPLKELMKSVKDIILSRQNQKLTSLNCHDIMCLICWHVISGGKRRSAAICFSDLDDNEMANAKSGNWKEKHIYRMMANISAVYLEKPDSKIFLREWATIANSDSGERGIYNLTAVKKQCEKIDREYDEHMRGNACLEIILLPYSFCCLAEIVLRPDDNIETLIDKAKVCAWFATIQSTFTNFHYLRPKWKHNCENNRIIGISITGQLDNKDLLTPVILEQLKKVVIKTSKSVSKILEVEPPISFCCAKPSGSLSQVTDSASGCHPRYSKYYIRRYRVSRTDPVFALLKDQGVKWFPEVGQSKDNYTTAVIEYPTKSPEHAITTDNWSSKDQVNWYLHIQKHWSTHNTSNTVYVKRNEWLSIGNMVYENWDDIIGMTFLPTDEHKYELAPYEEITKEQYEKMIKEFPKIDFTKLGEYEKATGDTTTSSREFACNGISCEIK